jgi:hypothetical protein
MSIGMRRIFRPRRRWEAKRVSTHTLHEKESEERRGHREAKKKRESKMNGRRIRRKKRRDI